MGLLRWMRGDRSTSVRAVGMGMELVPGDPDETGRSPLDLPDDWKRTQDR